ncbi:MAG: hypothetical protein ACRETM_09540 [Stenotrophobium sp.]
MNVILIAALLTALGLLLWTLSLRRRLQRLEATTRELLAELGAQPAALKQELAAVKPMLLTVEILNPMELARKESWFAGAFGSITPQLVQQIVYRRTRTIMLGMLDQFHVKAEVRLRAGK